MESPFAKQCPLFRGEPVGLVSHHDGGGIRSDPPRASDVDVPPTELQSPTTRTPHDSKVHWPTPPSETPDTTGMWNTAPAEARTVLGFRDLDGFVSEDDHADRTGEASALRMTVPGVARVADFHAHKDETASSQAGSVDRREPTLALPQPPGWAAGETVSGDPFNHSPERVGEPSRPAVSHLVESPGCRKVRVGEYTARDTPPWASSASVECFDTLDRQTIAPPDAHYGAPQGAVVVVHGGE